MIQIRDAVIEDCEQIGLITVTASHSAFIGTIPEADLDFSWTPEVSAAGWRKNFADNINRGQKFLVAEENDQVLGFACTKPWAQTPGFDACVQALYVLPSHHRRGIARQLLGHIASEFTRENLNRLEIGCVQENLSCNFYIHMGGVEVARRPVQVDRYETQEIVFGWPDVAVLKRDVAKTD
jgi:L-amino acid N-acyltransferase YncA